MSDYKTTVRTLEWLEEDQLEELFDDLSDETVLRLHTAVTNRIMRFLDKCTEKAQKISDFHENLRLLENGEKSCEQDYQDVDDDRRARELR